MSKLLINEPPLQVLPSLAEKIGLNEAIVLQQVHYWLGVQQKSQNDFCQRDDKWWVYKTYDGWHKEFKWWSLSTVKRTLNSLRDKGLLIAKELSNNPSDHTLWYTIDYDVLEALSSEETGLLKMNKPPGQDEQARLLKMNKSTYTENTTETTTDTCADAPAPQPFDLFEILCDVHGIDYERVPERRKGQELAYAKQLVDAGWTADEVRDCLAYMKSDDYWQGKKLGLASVADQIVDWVAAGRPAKKPNGGGNGTHQRNNGRRRRESGEELRQRLIADAKKRQQAVGV